MTVEFMKVEYVLDQSSRVSTAYLEGAPLPDGSYVGTNKHTDLPVHLFWNEENNQWERTCVREFDLVDVFNEKYEEVGPRPDCICMTRPDVI